MAQGHLDFDERLRRVGRKHRAMAQGYTFRMRPDGLMVATPYHGGGGTAMSFKRSIVFFLAAIVVFKAFLLAHLGPQTYEERLDHLRAGTLVERTGAYVMQSDPASRLLADQLGPLLR